MWRGIYYFLLNLRMKVKLLSEEEFYKILNECNEEEAIYLMYFRYC